MLNAHLRTVALRAVALTTLALFVVPVDAQTGSQDATEEARTIEVGSPAPEFEVSTWIKGKPVHRFQKDHVYVIDCWATWCGPCIRAIPHMSQIQEKYADQNVHVIGVSIWEHTPSAVPEFVTKQGDKMKYAVAMDKVPSASSTIEEGTRECQEHSLKGSVSVNWMDAAGRDSIPTVFIVDKAGRVAWFGHPNDMDEPLEKVVQGTHDYGKSEAASNEQKKRKLTERMRALFGQEDFDGAFEIARNNLESVFWNDPGLLNEIAWIIVDPEGVVEKKDLTLAMSAAERASALTNHQNAAILDTLARVWFLEGQPLRAVRLQRKALQFAEGRELRIALERALEEYQGALEDKDYY